MHDVCSSNNTSLKKWKLVGMVAEACNLSIQKAFTGKSHSKIQNNEMRMGEIATVWERACLACEVCI